MLRWGLSPPVLDIREVSTSAAVSQSGFKNKEGGEGKEAFRMGALALS